ncbi:unnamed protein product [Closterium sp. NIES-53]
MGSLLSRLLGSRPMASAGPTMVVKDLVLIGGGHSHVVVLKSFAMKPMPGVRLTLVTRDVHTPYSGMLPGLVAGHYTYDDCHIDLRPLAQLTNARLLHCCASGLDLDQRAVVLADGRPPIRYDVLSIDIGITPLQSVPGAKDLTLPVKPIDSFTHRWEALRSRILSLAPGSSVRVVVVGGGAGGVELLLAMQHRLQQDCQKSQVYASFVLITRGDLLPTHNARVRSIVRRILKERSVKVLDAAVVAVRQRGVESGGERVDGVKRNGAEGEVSRGSSSGAGGGEDRESALEGSKAQEGGQGGSAVQGGVLVLDGGEEVEFDECVWCTQGGAASWLAQTGLALDSSGFIRVGDTLESISHKGVFAAGDIHSSDVYPRPKAGVFAVRQGMPLAENLRRALLEQPLKPFRPQKTFLSLISTGDKYAVFSRGSLAFEDSLMWTLKDRIDRAFMRQFSQLPIMPSPPLPTIPVAHTAGPESLLALKSIPMRCGGCGSKVGSSLLSRVLTRLAALPSRPPGRPEILLGLDSPDDAAVLAIPPDSTGGRQNPVIVQTVDFFRSFLSDPHTFGRIAALHALTDCFAMGADPVSALAIVTLPYGTEEKMEEELFQVMAGAIRELDAATCQLVGGHTVEGAELSLGFAVTGLADRDWLLRKAGMCEGDAIILTKPIGTGVIFAANMRCKAKGRWVDGAIASMLVSNQKAAAIALQHKASAATDVTGFGLLGHLVEMTRASRVTVTIDPSTVPILDGALECVEEGIFSSLQDSNLRLRRAITNYEGLQQRRWAAEAAATKEVGSRSSCNKGGGQQKQLQQRRWAAEAAATKEVEVKTCLELPGGAAAGKEVEVITCLELTGCMSAATECVAEGREGIDAGRDEGTEERAVEGIAGVTVEGVRQVAWGVLAEAREAEIVESLTIRAGLAVGAGLTVGAGQAGCFCMRCGAFEGVGLEGCLAVSFTEFTPPPPPAADAVALGAPIAVAVLFGAAPAAVVVAVALGAAPVAVALGVVAGGAAFVASPVAGGAALVAAVVVAVALGAAPVAAAVAFAASPVAGGAALVAAVVAFGAAPVAAVVALGATAALGAAPNAAAVVLGGAPNAASNALGAAPNAAAAPSALAGTAVVGADVCSACAVAAGNAATAKHTAPAACGDPNSPAHAALNAASVATADAVTAVADLAAASAAGGAAPPAAGDGVASAASGTADGTCPLALPAALPLLYRGDNEEMKRRCNKDKRQGRREREQEERRKVWDSMWHMPSCTARCAPSALQRRQKRDDTWTKDMETWKGGMEGRFEGGKGRREA